MTAFKGDGGQPLGVRPTHLVVGISNMFTARKLLLSDQISGSSNPLKSLAELIVRRSWRRPPLHLRGRGGLATASLLTRKDHLMSEFDKCQDCGKVVMNGEVVAIPRNEYERLTAREHAALPDYRLRSATAIARNPEQAEFVISCLATMTVTEAHTACVERFTDNAPSRSQVFRFAADLGLRCAARNRR